MIETKLLQYRTHTGAFTTTIPNRRAMRNMPDRTNYRYFLEETHRMILLGLKPTAKGLDVKAYFHRKFS